MQYTERCQYRTTTAPCRATDAAARKFCLMAPFSCYFQFDLTVSAIASALHELKRFVTTEFNAAIVCMTTRDIISCLAIALIP